MWLLDAPHAGSASTSGAGRGRPLGHCAHPSPAGIALGSLYYHRGGLPPSPGDARDRAPGAGGLAPALAGDAAPGALPGLSSGCRSATCDRLREPGTEACPWAPHHCLPETIVYEVVNVF